MKPKYLARVMSLALALGLAACGGGEEGGGSSSGGDTQSGCGYTDLVSSSERAQANECGIQVSASYGMAAAYLADAIAACQRGDKARGDSLYNNQYQQTVRVARGTSDALSCGTATGGIEVPPSSQTYYNFCNRTTVSNGTANYQGSCWGPVVKDDFGCPSSGGNGVYTYVTQYGGLPACISARDNWLQTR